MPLNLNDDLMFFLILKIKLGDNLYKCIDILYEEIMKGETKQPKEEESKKENKYKEKELDENDEKAQEKVKIKEEI